MWNWLLCTSAKPNTAINIGIKIYNSCSTYTGNFVMGRTKQTPRTRNRKPNKPNVWQQDNSVPHDRGDYKLNRRGNEKFETYYKAQEIVPEGEWDAFMEALQSPLPCTFRVTGFKKQSEELIKLIKGEYLDKVINVEVEGRTIKPPKCLPWYPGELAWQLDMDRRFIRHCISLKKLHQFLIEETDSGNISRQEAVSMIPPLVMDIKPHHKVLDMCAAPGSKTAQLIEMLHAYDSPVPDGCVVANDSDNKRCYLMTHQIKRLESPSFVIVNQDASTMPNFKVPNEEGVLRPLRFDRILADVPCSGDGTMRKNIDVWGKWNVFTAMHLHNIQSRILSRGLEMLSVGGRLVYSTCSFNPIEDEAVLCNLLRRCQGTVRLVDIAGELKGLKGTPGISKWKVMSKDLVAFDKFEDLPKELISTIRRTCFPPSEEEAQKFELHKCLRILPHHQDTGGFFISALEKLEELPWVTKSYQCENARKPWKVRQAEGAAGLGSNAAGNADEAKENTDNVRETAMETDEGIKDSDQGIKESDQGIKASDEGIKDSDQGIKDSDQGIKDSDEEIKNIEEKIKDTDEAVEEEIEDVEKSRSDSPPQKRRKKVGYREDPFVFLSQDDPIWPPIRDFFKLRDFPVEQLLVRCTEGKKRHLYFASPIVKSLVTHNIDRLKFINLGLKILSRSDSAHVSCPYRTVQEGMAVFYPHVNDRVIELSKEDIVTLLSTDMPFLTRFSKPMREGLNRHLLETGQGSVVFIYDPTKDDRPDSPKCDIVLCGWLGRTSCRSFIAMNERGHYLRMCGAELLTKDQAIKRDEWRPEDDEISEPVADASSNASGNSVIEGNDLDPVSKVTDPVTAVEACEEILDTKGISLESGSCPDDHSSTLSSITKPTQDDK